LFTPIKPMLLSNHKVTPFSLTDPNLLYEIKAWVKRKHTEITETFILGYQVNPFALVVGLPNILNSNPVPVALVEYGFKDEEKIAFRKIAQQIHTEKKRSIQMIEPLLKCNVEYLERTNNGSLRICTFRGFVV
jgi:bifunctional non-homologous end joining protein LigD